MWPLVKKNSIIFIAYTVGFAGIFFPLLNVSWIKASEPFDFGYVFYQGSWISWIVLGSLWMQEQIEYKSKGYAFLRTLPLKKSEIVYSKFIVMFLTVLFFVGYLCTAYSIFPVPREDLALIYSYIIILGSINLLIAGLIYVGIFRYGFHKISKIIWGVWLFMFLSPVLIKEFYLRKSDFSDLDVIKFVTGFHWILILSISLIVYFLSLQLIIKQKKSAVI